MWKDSIEGQKKINKCGIINTKKTNRKQNPNTKKNQKKKERKEKQLQTDRFRCCKDTETTAKHSRPMRRIRDKKKKNKVNYSNSSQLNCYPKFFIIR